MNQALNDYSTAACLFANCYCHDGLSSSRLVPPADSEHSLDSTTASIGTDIIGSVTAFASTEGVDTCSYAAAYSGFKWSQSP